MPAAAPAPVTDPGAVFPELDALRRRAMSGDVVGTLEDLAALGHHHGPDESLARELLAGQPALEDVLETHLAAHPDDGGARTLLAHRWLVVAEDGLPGLRGREVSSEQLAHSRDLLGRAEESLLRLCAEDPEDPEAWVLRVRAARLRGLPVGEAHRRYLRLFAVRPHHSQGQHEYLRALVPPTGSWETAFAFAREVAAAAAPGTVECTVLATAHLLRWRAEEAGHERGYLRRREVLAELEDVADRFRAVPGPARWAWVGPHTELAVLFAVGGLTERARSHLRALGPLVAPEPWALLGRHRDALERLRAATLAEVRPS